MTTTDPEAPPARRTRVTITLVIDVDEAKAKRYVFPPTKGDPEGFRALDDVIVQARQDIVERIGDQMDGFLVDERAEWKSYAPPEPEPIPTPGVGIPCWAWDSNGDLW